MPFVTSRFLLLVAMASNLLPMASLLVARPGIFRIIFKSLSAGHDIATD